MTRAPRPKGREVESAGAWRACACFCVCVVQVQRYCLISGVEDGGKEGEVEGGAFKHHLKAI